MKKIILICLFTICLVGCTQAKEVCNIDNMTYEEIEKNAKASDVNIYMWGGDAAINTYMDTVVKNDMKNLYGINVNRVAINDPKDIINKLLDEKNAGKDKSNVDVLWINGENFKVCKENDLLTSGINKLPNYNKYIDKNDMSLMNDFRESTDDLEVPFGRAQLVFVYDSAKIENPPNTLNELNLFVKENPGKFTYPAPPDFTGSAFVRQVMINMNKDYFAKELYSNQQLDKAMKDAYGYLNDIKPYLWRNGTTYPESIAKLDDMYANSQVLMSMTYNPFHAMNKIKSGQFPSTSKLLVLDDTSLSNTHYLSVPFNSSNKEGAMVLINYLISPKAQIDKMNPSNWGDMSVLSYDKLNDADKVKMNKYQTSELKEIQKYSFMEISGEDIDTVEKGWNNNVIQ